MLFGAATGVLFSLMAQIGEQVDYLRFLPEKTARNRLAWWSALLSAGPGWIVIGGLKMLRRSFLAFLALDHGIRSPGRRADADVPRRLHVRHSQPEPGPRA